MKKSRPQLRPVIKTGYWKGYESQSDPQYVVTVSENRLANGEYGISLAFCSRAAGKRLRRGTLLPISISVRDGTNIKDFVRLKRDGSGWLLYHALRDFYENHPENR